MGAVGRPAGRDLSGSPWFVRRPNEAKLVAGLMFAAVFALRLADSRTEDAVSVLFVLPVALLAFTFGFRAGLASGVGSVGLLVAGTLIDGASLTPLGWTSRVLPLLLLGMLVGFASDQLREADRRELHFAEVALLQREAAEINDGIVQGLAVAKWLLEAGKTDRGLDAVNHTMLTAQTLVSRMLGAGSPLEGEKLRSWYTDPPSDGHGGQADSG